MGEAAYREGLRDSNQLEWVDSQYVAGQKAAGGWAMNHWLELRGTVWVMCDGIGCQPASDAEIEMWQELAKLRAECSQWRDELRIYRETENKRIAELEQAVTVRDTEIARLETDLELARVEIKRLGDALDLSALEYADLAVSAKSLEDHLSALVEVSEKSTIALARAALNGDDIGEDEDEDEARAGNGGEG